MLMGSETHLDLFKYETVVPSAHMVPDTMFLEKILVKNILELASNFFDSILVISWLQLPTTSDSSSVMATHQIWKNN